MIRLLGIRREAVGWVLLLAVLLLFGSEVLVWTNPPQRPLLEWLLLLPGYMVLSAVILDLIVRYRIRDLFGGLLLAGIYSLTAALILNPASTLSDMPRTLFTRVMGAHALIAAEMISLALLLTGGEGKRRSLLIGSVVVGLAWGIWVKNWPVQEGFTEVSLSTILAFGIGGVAIIGLLLYAVLPRLQPPAFDHSQDVLRLSPHGWMTAIAVVAGLFVLRLVREEIDPIGLVLCPLLVVLCWVIIWFRGRTRGDTLLDQHMPIRPLPLSDFLIVTVVFMGIGVIGYNLPDVKIGMITPMMLIGLGFTAYGLAWLPTVSLVLGVQGYLRQLAAQKM